MSAISSQSRYVLFYRFRTRSSLASVFKCFGEAMLTAATFEYAFLYTRALFGSFARRDWCWSALFSSCSRFMSAVCRKRVKKCAGTERKRRRAVVIWWHISPSIRVSVCPARGRPGRRINDIYTRLLFFFKCSWSRSCYCYCYVRRYTNIGFKFFTLDWIIIFVTLILYIYIDTAHSSLLFFNRNYPNLVLSASLIPA